MEQLNTNPTFKKAVIGLLVILIAFVAIKTISEIKIVSQSGKAPVMMNTISVSGKGEILTTPDIATFSFTVSEEAPIVSDAQKKATEKMNAILDYVKKSNVMDKDVKTLSYSIYPRYDYINATYYVPGKQVLSAYVVSQTIEIKVRKMEEAGNLLTGIGEFGATNVSGLSFSVDNQDELVLEAREKAIVDAREQAEVLAESLDVNLGDITSFYESTPYPISPLYYGREMMMANGMGGDGKVAAPQIPGGENTITSNVTITYEIK